MSYIKLFLSLDKFTYLITIEDKQNIFILKNMFLPKETHRNMGGINTSLFF
jgi:hypothetical protein